MKVNYFSFDTNNKQWEFKIKNRIPFTLAPPKVKYLNINLTKYVQQTMKKITKI